MICVHKNETGIFLVRFEHRFVYRIQYRFFYECYKIRSNEIRWMNDNWDVICDGIRCLHHGFSIQTLILIAWHFPNGQLVLSQSVLLTTRRQVFQSISQIRRYLNSEDDKLLLLIFSNTTENLFRKSYLLRILVKVLKKLEFQCNILRFKIIKTRSIKFEFLFFFFSSFQVRSEHHFWPVRPLMWLGI